MYMLVLQIALGIVIAVVALRFLPEILSLAISILIFGLLAYVLAQIPWEGYRIGFISFTIIAPILFAMWLSRHEARVVLVDASDIAKGMGKSQDGLTWLEEVSPESKRKGIIFGVSIATVSGIALVISIYIDREFSTYVPLLAYIGLLIGIHKIQKYRYISYRRRFIGDKKWGGGDEVAKGATAAYQRWYVPAVESWKQRHQRIVKLLD